MPTLKIPTPLRVYAQGQAIVTLEGATVGESMQYLVTQYPTLKQHLYNSDGDLRPFVNIFLGENNVKDLQGLDTPVPENAQLLLIPSIAGGDHKIEKQKATKDSL